MKLKAKKHSSGQYSLGKYIFTAHFFKQWRTRVGDNCSDEVIARKAYGRLIRSKMIAIQENSAELRQSNGLVFVTKPGQQKVFVVTVLYCSTYTRFNEAI